MNEAGFAELLDLIYGSIVEPGLWVRVIEGIADGVGGNSGWLSQIDVNDGVGSGIIARIDPEMPERYLKYYAPINPFRGSSHRRAGPSGAWSPAISVDEDLFEKDFLARSEYFNDFVAPQQIHHLMFMDLATDGANVATVNIHRPKSSEQFADKEVRFAEALLPHLVRAFKLGQTFSCLKSVGDDRAAALDLSPQATLIVGADGKVCFANKKAESIIARRDCLRISGGKLVAITADSTRRLQALIQRATTIDPTVRSGGAMALPSSLGSPHSLTVGPLVAERLPVFTRGATALISITELNSESEISGKTLQDLFGLTPAETRVVRLLLGGAKPKDIAHQSGTSLNTVRAQLASIYRKTDTTGQIELSRLITRIGSTS